MESKGSVLLVDDEPKVAKFFKWRLEECPYTVHTALSGNKALEFLRANEVEVLVTDIKMPGMTGIELMGAARKRHPDLQCIVITGYGDEETAVEAMRAGAINYLKKPVKPDELDVAVQKGFEKILLIREVRDKQERLERANAELANHKDHLEELVEKEIARRKKAENGLKKTARREALIVLMNFSLNYWKLITRKTKIELAEESKLWTLTLEKDGLISKTLDKYLRIDKLPKNPRFNAGVKTGYFVLFYPPVHPYPEMREKLKKQVEELETLLL